MPIVAQVPDDFPDAEEWRLPELFINQPHQVEGPLGLGFGRLVNG